MISISRLKHIRTLAQQKPRIMKEKLLTEQEINNIRDLTERISGTAGSDISNPTENKAIRAIKESQRYSDRMDELELELCTIEYEIKEMQKELSGYVMRPEELKVIKLFYCGGLTYKEIAKIMNYCEGYIAELKRNALENLY